MVAKIMIEHWAQDLEAFMPLGHIDVQVPFAFGKLNMILECIGELSKWFGSNPSPLGLYRLGGDDGACIEWDGYRPGITTAKRISKSETEIAVDEALLRQDN